VERGFDPLYGARPLKRAIQTLILDQLAMNIIEKKVDEGSAVIIDAKKEEVVIR
jgi:ATP-dependent Clp protease ATP-binding subunit ClpA